ncbi:hypothetical protein ACSIGC_05005 [Tenacibaculum sp. ZS6-P6]|uniref:hypothetical protein n=1 Tax=Tenacibaculum sp. ZS6-P6 TaxID=3447503 RepID=UPI003F9A53F7
MKKILVIIIISAILFSCEAIFVENISNKTVEVLAPKTGVTIDTGSITFSWNELEGADEYHLKIAKPNFLNANQIVLDTIITQRSFAENLIQGSYEWSVIGRNSEYESLEKINFLTIR